MTPWQGILLGQVGLSREDWFLEIFASGCIVGIPAILLFTVWNQIQIARRARLAGSLLLRARAPRWITVLSFVVVLLFILQVVTMACMSYSVVGMLDRFGFSMPPRVGELFLLGFGFMSVLLAVTAVQAIQFSIFGLELRDRGIFCNRRFVPWDQVACARWLKKKGRLRLEFANFYRRARIREDDVSETDALLRQQVAVVDECDASKGAPPRRKLRLFPLQFRLRTLMLVFVFAALVLGVFSWRFERVRTNRRIGARLEDAGATVQYMFGRVWSVDFSLRYSGIPPASTFKITDDDLADIGQLGDMVFLWLDGTDVSDAGLVHLATLAYLNNLSLNKTPITDEGLSHVAPLGRLTSLWLIATNVTDAGLEKLRGLTELRTLHLGGTRINGSAFRSLDTLTKMESLGLGGTDVDDAGLEHVAKLVGLTRLSLRETRITDAGLKHLARLPGLTSLDLRDTQITDAAVADLEGMKQLEYVGVSGTRMTPAGVARLQKALPAARIDFTPPAAPAAATSE